MVKKTNYQKIIDKIEECKGNYELIRLTTENKIDIYDISRKKLILFLCLKLTLDYCNRTNMNHNCNSHCYHNSACAMCIYDIYGWRGPPFTCKIWEIEKKIFPNNLNVKPKLSFAERKIRLNKTGKERRKKRQKERKLEEKKKIWVKE